MPKHRVSAIPVDIGNEAMKPVNARVRRFFESLVRRMMIPLYFRSHGWSRTN